MDARRNTGLSEPIFEVREMTMENTELQAIEDSKLLRRGTKVIHNGQKCVVLNFRHNGKGYEYFLSDRKWVKRH